MKKLIIAFLATLPLSACMIDAPEAARPDNRIAVIADPEKPGKYVAVPKKCPDWHYDLGDNFENDFRPQFNCAQMHNLAKMIDEPADLVRGREAGFGDASPGVLGVERYRQDKKKPLINPKNIESTTK
jgi:hypothetical protein